MFKDKKFAFRLSPAERVALFKTADVFGLSPSEFLREQLRTEARRLDFWPPSNGEVTQ